MAGLKEVNTMQDKKTNSKEIVPVFFGADQRFTPYMMVAVASMLANISSRRKYAVHILHTDINEETQNAFKAMARSNCSIEFHDVSPMIDRIVGSLPIRDYYSPSTYYRFLIASEFPQYDKALYIDSDTAIVDDVAKLYDTQIGKNYVGAVPEAVMASLQDCGSYSEKVLGINRHKYFNAGMLVINCKQWRIHDVMGQFLTLIGFYNFVVAQDQDYLNVICKNKVHYVSRRWNMEAIKTWKLGTNRPGIIHYAFAAKPWQDINCLYGEHFWKYASKLPVYMTIKAGFAQVTNEQLEKIEKLPESICATCREEIGRNDNFIRLVDSKKASKPTFNGPILSELADRLRAHA